MEQINLIAALGKNGVIGKANDLVWKGVPGDLKRFKDITTGHPIIMGRKTFESIGNKPLLNRMNIVVSRNTDFAAQGCITVDSLEDAINIAAEEKSGQIFVIGGGEVYAQAIGIADRLYLTLINAEAEGDAFFPNYSEFTKVTFSEDHPASEKFGHSYKFLVLEK